MMVVKIVKFVFFMNLVLFLMYMMIMKYIVVVNGSNERLYKRLSVSAYLGGI